MGKLGRGGREQVAAAGEAVLDGQALDRDVADRERVVVAELDHRTEQPMLAALRADVREDAVHRLFRLLHRVARQDLAEAAAGAPVRAVRMGVALDPRAVQRVEAAHVVEPRDVIHVRVRQHDGVHAIDAVFAAREPHFRRRVDEEADVARPHVGAAAATAVARIGRRADLARAADLRYADARSRPKELEGDAHLTGRKKACPDRGQRTVDRRQTGLIAFSNSTIRPFDHSFIRSFDYSITSSPASCRS